MKKLKQNSKLHHNTYFLILNSFHSALRNEKGFSMIEVIFVVVLMLSVLVWSGIFSPPKSDIVDSKIHYAAPNNTTNTSNEKNLQITDLKLEESGEVAPTPTPTRSPI